MKERQPLAVRMRVHVEGTVQGVGFRPFVYRLATDLGLSGFVRNDRHGVVVEVEGAPLLVNRFVQRLRPEAPPLACIKKITRAVLDVLPPSVFPSRVGVAAFASSPDASLKPRGAFRILDSEQKDSRDEPPPIKSESATAESAIAPVPPDTGTCVECVSELFDASNRRYRYPFINCTNCGPRFTIMRGVPYDRIRTTMAPFDMCSLCRTEYENPADRRFHAQPNACPVCGPNVTLVRPDGALLEPNDAEVLSDVNRNNAPAHSADAIARVATLLRAGAVIAVKGIGGYHLACLASHTEAVQRLRERKRRPDKPFAVMVRTLDDARTLMHVNRTVARLLESPARPIVLAQRRRSAVQMATRKPPRTTVRDEAGASRLAHNVAPGLREIGVMLPYSPLHHVLLNECGAPLVFTSGNRAGEPIAYRNEDARQRLTGIADAFLEHNRDIEMPTDDSVVRVVQVAGRSHVMMVRRSRGYVPGVLNLPTPATTPILGVGAQQKSTCCIGAGRSAWVGAHVGDLDQYESVKAFEESVRQLSTLFAVAPQVAAHDLHPEYASTQYALRVLQTQVAVQHHHAHFAACLAEHGITGPAVGVMLDGTGLGTDGNIWGGEVLVGNLQAVKRMGHLWPVRMPGGAAAIRHPWQMACGWLCALAPHAPAMPKAMEGHISLADWSLASQLARNEALSPLTTSAGRLLDAVAALCGIGLRVSYEGQAAMQLEAAAMQRNEEAYEIPLVEDQGMMVLDTRALIRAVVEDLRQHTAVAYVSARTHNGLAHSFAQCASRVAREHNLQHVALSGGVFQNALLLRQTSAELHALGLQVLVPEQLPLNDGGIAFGQVAVAAANRFEVSAPVSDKIHNSALAAMARLP